ncbi:MAG: hypothetical protein DMG30_01135 [Acidobacteria bacterium]|nr:MAG: hypothetical protein DMG30_01135 [Acidobacteriota bacterium]
MGDHFKTGQLDLYQGKLCAALDRLHARDFFDVKVLLEDTGDYRADSQSLRCVFGQQ